MPLSSRLESRVPSLEFRDEELASLDRKSHRSNPSPVTQPGTRRSSLRHVSEPSPLNPFATLCPYCYPGSHVLFVWSQNHRSHDSVYRTREPPAGSQSLPVLLIKTLPIIWQLVVRSCHGKSDSSIILIPGADRLVFSLFSHSRRSSCLSSLLLCLFHRPRFFIFAWPCFFDRGDQLRTCRLGFLSRLSSLSVLSFYRNMH